MHLPKLFSCSCMTDSQVRLYNVLLLGVSFCLIFGGFNTMNGIQTLVYESAMDPDSGGYVEGYHGNGLWSLATIYMVFTAANVLAPSIVAFCGPRVTLILGAITYAFFTAQLLVLQTETLYFAAVVVGIGSGMLWTAQGNILALNSDKETITRNSGIFWALFASSGFIGNLFVFFGFKGKETIDKDTRDQVGTILICLASAGAFVQLFLMPPPKSDDAKENEVKGPWQALKDSGKLFITKDMLLLCFTFFYTGLQLNIWSAVYATCIGFTHGFGDERKGLASISGMFVSFGEVLGGLLFGIFSTQTVRKGRSPIMIFGCITTLVAYAIAFINLPKEAPFGETTVEDLAIIESDKYLAIFTSFLLGFSDACFNTQVLSLLGGTFKDNSASAFAIYKFMQALASGIAFWYSPLINLYFHLLIATVFALLGTATFCYVEFKHKRKIDVAPASAA